MSRVLLVNGIHRFGTRVLETLAENMADILKR